MTRVVCLAVALCAVSCGDDAKPGNVDAAVDAPSGSGGAGGGGGGGAGGTGGAGGMTTDGGGQPLGSVCVMASQCDQSQGAATCCAVPGCSSPCECVLAGQCMGPGGFLPCMMDSDCDQFGGGKICCMRTINGQAFNFCTKPSGCN